MYHLIKAYLIVFVTGLFTKHYTLYVHLRNVDLFTTIHWKLT